jgi:hypothetical protein
VPKNKEIRDEILHNHHNSPNVGHPGIHRMLELIKRTYWWPMIKTDVTTYVKGCSECQKNKIIRQPLTNTRTTLARNFHQYDRPTA